MGSLVTIFENSAAHINIITVHQCIRLSFIYSKQPDPPLVALAWDRPKGEVGNHSSSDKGKEQGIPLQAWIGPEGFRMLRLPDFKTVNT
jgi:hypothetical protein